MICVDNKGKIDSDECATGHKAVVGVGGEEEVEKTCIPDPKYPPFAEEWKKMDEINQYTNATQRQSVLLKSQKLNTEQLVPRGG